VRPWEFTRITPSPGTVAAETVSFAAAALAAFFAAAFADVAAVVVAAGVLVLDELDELDELLPQPAAATASMGTIKIADIFFMNPPLDGGPPRRLYRGEMTTTAESATLDRSRLVPIGRRLGS
jgi:hypothetical protein